jgi:hypothetical protein
MSSLYIGATRLLSHPVEAECFNVLGTIRRVKYAPQSPQPSSVDAALITSSPTTHPLVAIDSSHSDSTKPLGMSRSDTLRQDHGHAAVRV